MMPHGENCMAPSAWNLIKNRRMSVEKKRFKPKSSPNLEIFHTKIDDQEILL